MADKYIPGMEFQSWRSLPRGPLADVGAAAKTGLMLYGLQKTGIIDALNNMGIKQNNAGGFSYQPPQTPASPAGSVVPSTLAPAAAAPVPPVPSDATGTETAAPAIPQPSIQATPLPSMSPDDSGKKILDGEYHGEADEDQFKARDVAQDQLPQQFAQGIAPPNQSYPQPPQSNGGLMKLLAAFA